MWKANTFDCTKGRWRVTCGGSCIWRCYVAEADFYTTWRSWAVGLSGSPWDLKHTHYSEHLFAAWAGHSETAEWVSPGLGTVGWQGGGLSGCPVLSHQPAGWMSGWSESIHSSYKWLQPSKWIWRRQKMVSKTHIYSSTTEILMLW